MHQLTQFRLCPSSRSIRLALAEIEVEVELIDEQPWAWRPALLALNPAGELPVLEIADGPILCGAYAISEYLTDAADDGPPLAAGALACALYPGNRENRAEVRRLVDWFHRKLDREVTRELVAEKLTPVLSGQAAAPPTAELLRALRANLRYHMSYVSFLADQRRWLAGDELSFADLSAAAHLSVIDYLGEVPWEEFANAKAWYQRIKSRRAFWPILADRVPGAPPPPHYADLDF